MMVPETAAEAARNLALRAADAPAGSHFSAK